MKRLKLILGIFLISIYLCGCSKENDFNINQDNENNQEITDSKNEDIITTLTNQTPNGYQLYTWKVTMSSTFGNSIFPNNTIGIFVDSGKTNEAGHIINGYVVTNIKVLAVLDKNNENVFKDSSNIKEPDKILFYLTNKEVELLNKAKTLKENKKILSLKIVPVNSNQPNNQEVIDYILNN